MGFMICLFVVNLMRGISVYGSCIVKIVDDIMIKDLEYLLLVVKMMIKDGTMAYMRVINVRSIGLI